MNHDSTPDQYVNQQWGGSMQGVGELSIASVLSNSLAGRRVWATLV